MTSATFYFGRGFKLENTNLISLIIGVLLLALFVSLTGCNKERCYYDNDYHRYRHSDENWPETDTVTPPALSTSPKMNKPNLPRTRAGQQLPPVKYYNNPWCLPPVAPQYVPSIFKTDVDPYDSVAAYSTFDSAFDMCMVK